MMRELERPVEKGVSCFYCKHCLIVLCLPLALFAFALGGCSIFGPTTPPGAVAGITASDGTDDGAVVVTWNSLEEAERYSVTRASSSHGRYTELAVVSTARYEDKDAVEGSVYWYVVRACNDVGCGEGSVPDSGYVRPLPPPPPTW